VHAKNFGWAKAAGQSAELQKLFSQLKKQKKASIAFSIKSIQPKNQTFGLITGNHIVAQPAKILGGANRAVH